MCVCMCTHVHVCKHVCGPLGKHSTKQAPQKQKAEVPFTAPWSVCSFLFDSREVKGPSLLKIAGERVGPRFLRAVPCLASTSNRAEGSVCSTYRQT